MKKICILLTSCLLLTGLSYAGNGGGTDSTGVGKAKEKKKKPAVMNCPGKTCSKQNSSSSKN
jgi:hypothetical protein